MLYDNYMTECCIVCLKMYQRLHCGHYLNSPLFEAVLHKQWPKQFELCNCLHEAGSLVNMTLIQNNSISPHIF